MTLQEQELNKYKCEELRDLARELIQRLDELDELDYFGTEGWRNMLMGDD